MPIDPSIPLGIKPPQFMTPMEAQSNAMTLKAQMQQAQLRQQEIQQNAATMADQQRVASVWADRSNLDQETGLPKMDALVKAGVSPALIQKFNTAGIEAKSKKVLTEFHQTEAIRNSQKTKEEAAQKVREDSMAEYAANLSKGEKSAIEAGQRVYSSELERLKKTGMFSKEEIDSVPTEFEPKRVQARLLGHKESLVMEEKKKADDRADRRQDETERHNRTSEERLASIAARGAAGGPGSLQGDALDLAANQLLVDGKMPAGFARNTANVGAIYKRAAELAKSKGQTAEAALFNSKSIKSDQTSLTNITKQSDMITAFESTALKNLDMLVAQSAKVPRTSFPLLNKAILTGKLETGDPEVAKLHAIVRPFVDEYAKILSGQTGAAGASDTARREAAGIIAGYMAPDQINQLAPFIRQELKNRTGSLEEQREVIKARMGSGGKPAAAEKPAAASAKAAQTDADKAAVAWAKANPNDPRAKKIMEHNGGL